jgi:enoyl-CoA hydratase
VAEVTRSRVLKIERIDRTLVWTITRPEAKNALNRDAIEQLLRAADDAGKDPTLRAVVLTGEGDTFVSGGDLRELRDAVTAKQAEEFSEAGAALCAKLEALPVPVIAALPGPALGGGVELALACDLRVADARARLSFRQVRMGVTTAWGSVARLVALVGRSTAARLLYTSHEISATDAKTVGLVDEVVSNGSCTEVAIAWALDVTHGSPTAIASMKALLRTACAPSDALAAEERRRFVGTWTSADHTEAMDAYFARRPPKWLDRE